MKSTAYQFSIGNFSCAIVNDGTFAYPSPAQLFFDGAPEERLAQALQAQEIEPATWTEFVSSYPTVLVITGAHRVLIDTGAGGFAPTTGQLIPNLRLLDVAPEEIDTVVLTHGHLDHIGGNVDREGRPAFPNARYVMSRVEWEFWATDPDLSSLKIPPVFIEAIRGTARAQLPPLKDQLALVEDGDEIVPGIQAVAAPGHTPGHLALSIRSAGQQLLCAADTLLHPVHVEQPDWTTLFDYSPDETVVTRRRLLGQAAVDTALVHLTHFSFPGLGRIVLQDGSWRWRPLQ